MHYDCVIVGAGFGGLRALYEIRAMGMSARLFEAGSDIGGTWYWNRYPGARTDTDAWAYCYSFPEEQQRGWGWPERLPRGEHVQAYLTSFVDRYGLRDSLTFNARLARAAYDAVSNQWTMVLDDGQRCTGTYFIAATGLLTVPAPPNFEGMSRFKGETYMSMRWPKQGVDLKNKTVSLIGSGSTAVQILPLIAETAAKVYMFQRTPNYVLPARNYDLAPAYLADVRKTDFWKNVRAHPAALPWELPTKEYAAMTPAEARQALDKAWEEGGFRFIYNTFSDLIFNPAANAAASEYVRQKIRAIVKDPAVAALLCPDHPIGLKRPPLGFDYYETFNKPEVTLVDVRDDPIREITEDAIRTATRRFETDVIIAATGFEAGTGALGRIDIRGIGDASLKDKWRDGLRTCLGIMVDGFPNMFMISGPQSAIGNLPPIAEHVVKWIGDVIARARAEGGNYIEPTHESVEKWTSHILDIYNVTPMPAHPELGLWQTGGNIPGKPPTPLFYFGGANRYCDALDQSIACDLEGFSFRPSRPVASRDRVQALNPK